MKYTTLTLNKISKLGSPESFSILDYLSLITPEKYNWWSGVDRTLLAVDFWNPFGFLDFGGPRDADFIDNIDSCLEKIKDYFHLKKILISRRRSDCGGIFRDHLHIRSFSGIVLSPAEAEKLHNAIVHGSFDDSRHVHVLLDSPKNSSLYRIEAPADFRIKDVVTFLDDQVGNENIKELMIFNPLSRQILTPETKVGPLTNLIALGHDVRSLDIRPAGVLKCFSSRRDLSLRQTAEKLDSRTPCCNCLACSAICPSGLSPNILFHFSENEEEDTESMGAGLCFQCNYCTWVCPSNIPLAEGIGGVNDSAR